MPIRLYDLTTADRSRAFSPHCWKVAMALAHKGLPFESVPVTFTEVPAVEGGFAKTVPVIRDGDHRIVDSFEIARYLEETYPDRPTLFGGAGGEAMARFIERWSQTIVHPYLGAAVLMELHDQLAPVDQAHFRQSREARFGKRLEEVPVNRDAGLEAWRKSLEPMRNMLRVQPFIGGTGPLFPDYILFGALQWVRVISPYRFLEEGDPVAAWFEQCLDLYDGLGRRAAAAA